MGGRGGGMGVLGIDVGARRVGLAISDPTQTLARPLKTLSVNGRADAVARVLIEIERLGRRGDGRGAVVVGLPSRLDGSPSDQTPRTAAFVAALAARTSVPIARMDERLTSWEADGRLARNEPSWRRRKAQLDAAAAAVILQDYLDRER